LQCLSVSESVSLLGRRTILKAALGAGAVVVGGVGFRASRQNILFGDDRSPFEAWDEWETESARGGLALIEAAVLAANPHNTQPWRFRATERAVEVHADLERNLGSFDPFRRELHLGLGCALENVASAALRFGLDTRVSSFPEAGNPRLVARIELIDGAEKTSARADAIARRHTHRGRYLPNKVVPDSARRALIDCAEDSVTVSLFEAGSAQGRAFVDSTVFATDRIVADAEMAADSDRWYRHEWSDIARLRDGITVQAAGLPPWLTALASLGPRPSAKTSHDAWARSTRDTHCKTAPLFGVVSVKDRYDKPGMLRAGAVWQRVHLRGTALGLALQPLNQMVELADRDRQLGRASDAETRMREIAGSESQVTFAFRCGYAEEPAGPSARRPAKSVLF
jgi:hypothetical protein